MVKALKEQRVSKVLRKIRLILLTAGVTVGAMILIEEGFQSLLFSDVQMFQKLRDPIFYVSGKTDDEYWILDYWMSGKRESSTATAHPLLGWIGDFSSENFRHHATEEIGNRVPVLLYGGSLAECVGLTKEKCFQGVLNTETAFAEDYFLLNYGVDGYGLDQIFLLFKHSIEYYAESHMNHSLKAGARGSPFIIISLWTHDLDWSLLSVRQTPKPYFHLIGDQLVLRGTPIHPDPHKFFIEHAPTIGSYLYRLTINQVLPIPFLQIREHPGHVKWRASRINKKILLDIIGELRERKVPHVFLIFNTPEEIHGVLDDWRDALITGLLQDHDVPFISSRAVIRRDAKAQKKKIEDYYLPDTHPNADQIRLLSKEIKRFVLTAHGPVN